MDPKKDMLWRVYVVYFLVCLFAVCVFGRIVQIQFVQGEEWIAKAETFSTQYRNIEAVRGNIYASDGSLLATSVPIYEVRFDPNCEALTDEYFKEYIDSLSICLADLFQDKSAKEYARELSKARKNGSRYHLIKRRVKYTDLKKMREFPIFSRGKYKGGFIYMQQNKRQRPFQELAARTIGYDREGIKPVGLEGAYKNELKGVSGVRLMQKIAGGTWKPITDENEVEPEDGADLYTTLDVNIQDVAHDALLEQLRMHNADHGCVVLMEVSTGNVRAISNLTRGSDGVYYEKYNYVIGESTEPGSTFKLASMMVGLEEGYFDLTDSVDTEDGTTKFYDRIMRDSHKGGYGVITAERAFEVSSNVGISKLIYESYSKNPQSFIDRLYKMNLHQPNNVEIAGEGKPMIKNTKDKTWSGVTLPWMSIGYEVSLTPLQILTFYNAVANDGRMVKPKFATEIRKRGKVVKTINTEVINEAICSKGTLEKVKKMLEGVVENGTAINLKNANYKIAGKTGTAQIANDKYGYYGKSGKSYQASFCGYFPADNPKYSCIVVVNAPSNNVYYGNLVAGPIFKEIADKVYANSIEIHEELTSQIDIDRTPIPVSKNGSQEALVNALAGLDVAYETDLENNQWAITMAGDDKVGIKVRKVVDNLVPNVTGMDAADAIYLLENAGLVVRVKGKGMVKDQSIKAGQRVIKGSEIAIELS